jgi:ABC-type polysaccharide/polyol phosphate transport system ATPase subunit
MPLMKELCDFGLLMVNGRAKLFDDIDEAIEQHKLAMSGQIPVWAQN